MEDETRLSSDTTPDSAAGLVGAETSEEPQRDSPPSVQATVAINEPIPKKFDAPITPDASSASGTGPEAAQEGVGSSSIPISITRDDGAPSAGSPHAMSGHSVELSIDSDVSDDSYLGEHFRPSSSVSVNSSVYNFVEDFGRTFHRYKEGKYAMPNDQQEQYRLDLQHAIMDRVLKGKLNLAPVKESARVIDLGTGTGIWAVYFAEKHPPSSVLGTDLSPIQPEYVPANCRFEVDDCEDDWTWSYQFDYVHARYLVPFLADIPKLLARIYENLVPGGYVEFQEAAFLLLAVDDSLNGKPLQKWNNHILEGMRRTGREPLIALRLKELLIEAGFVNIHEKRIAIPINTWAKGEEQKVIGAMETQNFLEVCHGISMNILCKVLGWSTDQVEILLVEVKENIRDRRIHAYFPFICIWAQKPEN